MKKNPVGSDYYGNDLFIGDKVLLVSPTVGLSGFEYSVYEVSQKNKSPLVNIPYMKSIGHIEEADNMKDALEKAKTGNYENSYGHNVFVDYQIKWIKL